MVEESQFGAGWVHCDDSPQVIHYLSRTAISLQPRKLLRFRADD